MRAGCLHRLDRELKALALRKTMRQSGDDARQRHIAPFPLGRQGIRQTQMRPPAGPGKTERECEQNNPSACANARERYALRRKRPASLAWRIALTRPA